MYDIQCKLTFISNNFDSKITEDKWKMRVTRLSSLVD